MMLHSIFCRAVRDRIIAFNPCEETELPKVLSRRSQTLTPAEFTKLLQAAPVRYRLMLTPAIETGLRWGEIIALKPRHLDLARNLTVEETIVKVHLRAAPLVDDGHGGTTRQRMLTKPYPKNNHPRTPRAPRAFLTDLAGRVGQRWAL
jgi:integrase